MLKRFESGGHQSSASKSTIREMRTALLASTSFPQPQIQILWPKKSPVTCFKLKATTEKKVQHVVVDKDKQDKQRSWIYVEGCTIPQLKLLHQYPAMLPRFQADRGAVRFIMNGANVMCQGLTNEKAHMDQVKEAAVVGIYAEGFEHALAIGITSMSTQQIRSKNEGTAVQVVTYVGDGWWQDTVKDGAY